jgi:hypothetical protein
LASGNWPVANYTKVSQRFFNNSDYGIKLAIERSRVRIWSINKEIEK